MSVSPNRKPRTRIDDQAARNAAKTTKKVSSQQLLRVFRPKDDCQGRMARVAGPFHSSSGSGLRAAVSASLFNAMLTEPTRARNRPRARSPSASDRVKVPRDDVVEHADEVRHEHDLGSPARPFLPPTEPTAQRASTARELVGKWSLVEPPLSWRGHSASNHGDGFPRPAWLNAAHLRARNVGIFTLDLSSKNIENAPVFYIKSILCSHSPWQIRHLRLFASPVHFVDLATPSSAENR